MADIPTTTTFDDLLDAIIAKMVDITGIDSSEVIIGTLNSVDLSQQIHASGDKFIEIIIRDITGIGYESQREIRTRYSVELHGHMYVENQDRISGTDMKNIESFGIAIKTQLYSMYDDSPAPCTGFRLVDGDFSIRPLYQEYDQHINTVIINIGFTVDTVDTSA